MKRKYYWKIYYRKDRRDHSALVVHHVTFTPPFTEGDDDLSVMEDRLKDAVFREVPEVPAITYAQLLSDDQFEAEQGEGVQVYEIK